MSSQETSCWVCSSFFFWNGGTKLNPVLETIFTMSLYLKRINEIKFRACQSRKKAMTTIFWNCDYDLFSYLKKVLFGRRFQVFFELQEAIFQHYEYKPKGHFFKVIENTIKNQKKKPWKFFFSEYESKKEKKK